LANRLMARRSMDFWRVICPRKRARGWELGKSNRCRDLCGGHNYPPMVRKTEKKPIRT
jgi:hypothetical protein